MVVTKQKSLISIVAFLICISSGNADATLISIDFNDGVSAGDPIDNFYSNLGITFNNAEWNNDFNGRPGTSSPFQISSINSENRPKISSPIIGVFNSSFDMVSISAIDVGFNDARLDVYDAISGGNLLDFDLFEGVSPSGNTLTSQDTDILMVSISGIRRFELYQPINEENSDGVTWDNLTFNQEPSAVPEPSSIFGTAMVMGLGMTMKRRISSSTQK